MQTEDTEIINGDNEELKTMADTGVKSNNLAYTNSSLVEANKLIGDTCKLKPRSIKV